MTHLSNLLNKKERSVVGLISGTSMDGVSAVLIKLKGAGEKTTFQLIKFITYPYPIGLKEKIISIISDKKVSLEEFSRLNLYIGKIFADAVLYLSKKTKIPLSRIDIIGSHGQTIWHSPRKKDIFGYKTGSSIQLGDPTIISIITGIPTVGDFRTADILSGGEGAPLIPYFDYLMLKDKNETRIILNIGGISNITFLPKNCAKKEVIGFDCGPGNLLIDQLAKILFKTDFDKNGKLASKGKPSIELLNFLKKHPFINKKPPKSSGREDFGETYIKKILNISNKLKLKPEDIISTVTEFTPLAIYVNYRKFINKNIDRIIISGGGAKNKHIITLLKKYFYYTPVEISDKFGIPSDAKEAIAFAVYANETISGNPINLPSVTGANKEHILGKICLY
jgi:anhydro-N-acetylmuramic acid kinase